MMDCDTLLTVGSNFPYTQFLPNLDQARAIQIDRDGQVIGMRYPYELNLVADAKATLQALIPLLERKDDRSWRDTVEKNVAGWWNTMQRQAMTDSDPRQPACGFLGAQSSSCRTTPSSPPTRARPPTGMPATSNSRGSARVAVGHAGHDGSRSALRDRRQVRPPGPTGHRLRRRRRHADERHGRAHHRREVLAGVVRPSAHRGRPAQQRSQPGHLGDAGDGGLPKFVESQSLPDFAYAGFARSLGLHAIEINEPGEIGGAWEQALAADRPTVLDVHTDPDVPPIPPHATFDQAKSLVKACSAATRTPGRSSSRASNRKCRSSCRDEGHEGPTAR